MIRKIINVLWVLLAVALIAIVVVFVSISKGWIGYMPPVEELENPNYKFATEVFSEDGKVLDYLEDFPDRSLQTVEFGKNLTDVKITRDHTERVTALIPLGAKLTETDEDGNESETDTRLDITAVNDGKNYVYDAEAVKEIGWIWTTEVWEDVTLAGNLLRKAKARIAELAKGVTSMELTIVLSLIHI